MAEPYDLSRLDASAFENLANALALRVLGAGHTGFAPGADGGRDGYFEGEAPYPSETDRWSGRWYIQSKFHKPHLSTQSQKWLLDQIEAELSEFEKKDTKRIWPDNWIVATNIDPTGVPSTGSFDRAREIVSSRRPQLSGRFHIWGGRKVLNLLSLYPQVAKYYYHFLTPGQVLSSLHDNLRDERASSDAIIRHLAVDHLTEQQYTKLEQAGSTADTRPKIQDLFTDLPFGCPQHDIKGLGAQFLARTAAQNHQIEADLPDTVDWRLWLQHPARARTWFIKGGPGQGKSTLGQYFCQIQRAALILSPQPPPAMRAQKALAREIKEKAQGAELWPIAPRIPVTTELKEYARWFGRQTEDDPRGLLTYIASQLSASLEQPVLPGTLKRMFSEARWAFIFDGLDEVSSDVKDFVAQEVIRFANGILIECKADALTICTSRPQGYSGQLAELGAANIELSPLSPKEALACAAPVLKIDRSKAEFERHFSTLKDALNSLSIQEIMTTPLQAHIMAVVIRGGGQPPERKWQLFANFYQVIKMREANRKLADGRLSTLLKKGDKLLKALHNRLGFELHFRAERSDGAQTYLERSEFEKIVNEVVSRLYEADIEGTIRTLTEASTQRLVLVSTPESGEKVRFDIRALQEFFAAEYIYEGAEAARFRSRLSVIAGDSHWREVMHFLLSAIVENDRPTEFAIAVSVLDGLNSAADNSSETMFHRRIGLGSILVARLLQEGVLEQDKGYRQNVRNTLEPMLGFTDTETLYPLVSVGRVQSKAWLTDFLSEKFVTLSPGENIGAAYALARILDNMHPRVPNVKAKLLTAPPEYRAALFSMLFANARLTPSSASTLPGWMVTVVLDSLAAKNWQKMGQMGVRAAFGLLELNLLSLQHAMQELQLHPDLASLLRAILKGRRFPNMGELSILGDIVDVIRIEYYSPELMLDVAQWQPDLALAASQAPGALGLCFALLWVGRRQWSESAQEIMAATEGRTDLLEAFPQSLLAYLPREIYDDMRDGIRSVDIANIRGPTWNVKPGYMANYTLVNGRIGADKFDAVFRSAPDFAYRYALETMDISPESEDLIAYFKSCDGVHQVVKALQVNPEPVGVFPNLWGKLVALAESCKMDARTLILNSVREPELEADGDIFPFAVDLPRESRLLPQICRMLIELASPARPYRRSRDEAKNKPVHSLVCEYFPDAVRLFELASDITGAPLVRVSAAILYLLHPEAGKPHETECLDVIVDSYAWVRRPWYLQAAGVGFTAAIEAGDINARRLFGRLLEQSQDDFVGRMRLDVILDRWREKSQAPVHRVGAGF